VSSSRRQTSAWIAIPLSVAVVCALTAIVGIVLNLTADRQVTITDNLVVNQPGPVDASNSPSVVRNPRRRANLVVSYRVDRPGYSAVIQTTFDEGASWIPTVLPLPAGQDRPFAPDVAFSSDGVLHVVYSNLTGNGNTPDNLWVATSTDGGRTLGAPVRVSGPLAFQPRLAVGSGGAVFLTWLQAESVGLLRFTGAPPVVVSSHSTDGGQTFSAPMRVSDVERVRVGAATPVVDGGGRLQVLYEDFKDDRRDYENLEGPAYEGMFALVLSTSADGGVTFSVGREVESDIVPSKRFFAFLPDFPSLGAGPGAHLYVAWADARGGDEDVYLRHSGDGGASWSAARRVNANPARDGTAQYLPRVAVAPGGRVDVLYLDRRADRTNNVMTEVYLSTSDDHGGSFDDVRASDKAFDSRVGPMIRPEFGVDFGSRLGLTSSDRTTVGVWTDTRFGTDATGRQDIVGAAVQFPDDVPLLARSSVVLGVAFLGGVALAAGLIGRRRSSVER
jgi:hypothetical protein